MAGSKLELVLYRLSGTPLKGLLLGTGVTAVIQSSSATSVMVVGFVNSGMMKTEQAISVIMGAIIGTSVTGWIICLSALQGSGWVSIFSTSTLTAVVAVIGICLRMFSDRQQRRQVGDILLGFAVLMFGMQAMSSAVSPLRDSPAFVRFLTSFSNPILGVLAGAVFTSILQSASAAVGILQALSMTGAVTFSVAFPIILGIGIGAAVPVLLTALGARVEGRRTAFAYLAIQLAGAVICGTVFYLTDHFFDYPIKFVVLDQVGVAALNTVFRAVIAAVLLPLIPQLYKLVCAVVRENQEERLADVEFDRLDDRFLKHPPLAVEQSRLTVNAMAQAARENLERALGLIDSFSEAEARMVEKQEELIDTYEDRIGTYLTRLNSSELNREQNENVSKFLHALSDLERISDHAMNITETAREISEKNIVFTSNARQELSVLTAALREILETAVSSFIDNDINKAYRVEPLEERIDILCDEMKLRHIERVQMGKCSLSQGFVFNDLLTNIERVSDHCSNLAIAMIELEVNAYDTHGYLLDLKELRSHSFDELYQHFSEKYVI